LYILAVYEELRPPIIATLSGKEIKNKS